MKKLSKNILPFLSISTLVIFTACSKPDIISVSDTHLYNQDFGIIKNSQADEAIRQEFLVMNQPTLIDMPHITDPEISTKLEIDSDAFLAHEFVQTAPIITYKYEFDPKFYSKAEWRAMDLE